MIPGPFGDADPQAVGILAAIVLGIVEGLTEFLPVSSTGHLIVADRLLGHDSATMEIGIQAGAITAILVLYRARLQNALVTLRQPRRGGGGLNLLFAIAVAALPAIVLGKLFHDRLEATLMTPTTVAITTFVGGLLLLVLEGWLAKQPATPRAELEELTLRRALVIGAFQTLALVPGTSRSGSTIAGGLLCGLSRKAAAEFSFLVGLPILYGACILKLWKVRAALHGDLLRDLLIGGAVAFVTALLVVRPFVRFLERHTFVPFAIYRVFAGIAFFVFFHF